MKVEIFGSTDVGQVRDHNEDNFVLCKDLSNQDWTYKRDEQFDLGPLGAVLFVADGMGGTNAGEVASDIAQASIEEEFRKVTALPGDDQAIMAFVKKVIVKAHQNIVARTHEDPTTAGMGTTAVVCWVVKDKAFVAWSGDSRMYLYREGSEFSPITDDHSIVWELVKNGQLTAEEARLHENSNIITQSLGDEARGPKPDAKMVPLHKGDRLMLCSDGLSGMVSDNMLGGILSGRLSTADTCKELINAANAGGGTDNITVLLLDVLDGSAAPVASPSASSSSNIKTTAGKGAASPINTVESKSGPSKGLIAGILLVVALVVAGLVFVLKPTALGFAPDPNDTLVNPIDTNLTPTAVDTPTTVTPEPEVEEPVETTPPATTPTTTTTTPISPAPTTPNKPAPKPAPTQPPGTQGEKPDAPGGTAPKPTPTDPNDLPGVNITIPPKDTAKPPTITPRNPAPPVDEKPTEPDGKKKKDNK